MDTPILSVRNIQKSFGSNAVLRGINLDVFPGEVLALIGGNGAGKSTLVKSIMGIYKPEGGEIFIRGEAGLEKLEFSNPAASLNKGVYLVPQEPMLFPNQTVEQNILMGMGEKKSELLARLHTVITVLGWKLDLGRSARSLTIAEQQLVEILRGLLRDAKLLILDEPTSALTFDEVNSLFAAIETLRQKNIGVIYITHRLNEVFQIATRVAIMRDGLITLTGEAGEFDRAMLVKGLLPEDFTERAAETERRAVDYRAQPVFELRNFSGYGFADISLKLYPGEILGFCGVVGAGRTELAMTVFGRDRALSGRVFLDGEDITGMTTGEITKKGVNYVPEDRFLNGIFRICHLAGNITSACLRSMSRFFLNSAAEGAIAEKYVEDFRIKTTGIRQEIGSLSGGNQQKAVMGRALTTKPRVVILDEPTRGIDAGARGDIYAIINGLKKENVAVLLISSDMEEIVELSDRAVAMFQGRISGEFTGDEITQDNLMRASFGVTGAAKGSAL
ncbi:MAG: sugar ABC transporter ATP-binding protein [Spirochaetaceae bacterium]|jgi:AI-2 transport system ATP-binding protein|nr:sugar ABC transporter ATP-binding protein [Spirochaetaceae bacterium]